MTNPDAPYHAHIYYGPEDHTAAAALREDFGCDPAILLVGPMIDAPVGPHPIAQYEVHFLSASVPAVVAMIEKPGLRALVHPLPDAHPAHPTHPPPSIADPA